MLVMKTPTPFRAYEPDQMFLLPPQLADWLPEDHLVYFIRDIVRQFDLSAFTGDYDGSRGGQPAYHPTMMVGLLLYAYCVGEPSSRRIERATYESVPFRLLAADQHPDHDTISEFRKRHLKALSDLFLQALRLCQKAGLVKLGHVALDGTKMRANASKHKAMSYDRLCKSDAELTAEIKQLLDEAAATDAAEDARYGRGVRGDELPQELRRRESRLATIRHAKAALEEEARQRAEAERPEYEKKKQDWDDRAGSNRGREPKPPSDTPDAKDQRNFTDEDSGIMKDGATKSFEQSYNCQAAVVDTQVIVAGEVTQDANDKQQAQPMAKAMKENLEGAKPGRLTADAGYYSEENVEYLAGEGIDAYIATGRIKRHEKPLPPPRGRIPKSATAKERMARKLRTARGRATYSRRKAVVEPVFGQIKEARGLRRFLLRGLEKVRAEWKLICATHNLLKVFRSGWRPAPA
jgi:transposase